MELGESLSSGRRRTVAAIVVVAAMVCTFAVASVRSDPQSVASVDINTPLESTTSANNIALYLSSLDSALSSPDTTRAVQARTGQPAGTASVEQIGNSTVLKVTNLASSAAAAAAGADAYAREAAAAVARRKAAGQAEEVETARARYLGAQDALTQFRSGGSPTVPGNTSAEGAALEKSVVSGLDEWNVERRDLASAEAAVSRTTAANFTANPQQSQSSPLLTNIQTAVVAGLVAAGAMLAVFVLSDLLARRGAVRRSDRRTVDLAGAEDTRTDTPSSPANR